MRARLGAGLGGKEKKPCEGIGGLCDIFWRPRLKAESPLLTLVTFGCPLVVSSDAGGQAFHTGHASPEDGSASVAPAPQAATQKG